ncbi:protein Mdm4-like isoform X2 [Melanaphis sacchari]|uniref:protein Mdm4-like isoform X2 n=1 Tax=Melanaphis sacchari TaxID=742174 RepID=UPI000DC13841|nr:protein Mdm4-like isoform X2 [Melanaphis sacchari]
MPPQTLKRPTEDVYNSDDEYDMGDTWVNKKKSRYLYTYKLKSPDDLFENINDSDQSESIDSTQSKATIEVGDILDFSSVTSCPSDCDCDSQNSSQSDSDYKSSSQSESEISKNDIFLEDGYVPEDTDLQIFISESNFKFPVIFKNCCKCQKPNSNHYFQYCNQCFKHRMQLIESTSNPKPKSIKRLYNMPNRTEENYLPKDSQESSSTSNSQESLNSLGISGLCLSQDNTLDNTFENTTNSCNVCFLKPKNGIFNHGKTAHVYCCYTCAKHIWSRSGKCPICNLKIRYVTKAVRV